MEVLRRIVVWVVVETSEELEALKRKKRVGEGLSSSCFSENLSETREGVTHRGRK